MGLWGLYFYALADGVVWRGLTDRCGETSGCMQACDGRGSGCDGIRERQHGVAAFDDPKACGFIGGDGDRGGVS